MSECQEGCVTSMAVLVELLGLRQWIELTAHHSETDEHALISNYSARKFSRRSILGFCSQHV